MDETIAKVSEKSKAIANITTNQNDKIVAAKDEIKILIDNYRTTAISMHYSVCLDGKATIQEAIESFDSCHKGLCPYFRKDVKESQDYLAVS